MAQVALLVITLNFLVEGHGIVIGRKGALGKVIYLWDNFFPIGTTYYIEIVGKVFNFS